MTYCETALRGSQEFPDAHSNPAVKANGGDQYEEQAEHGMAALALLGLVVPLGTPSSAVLA